MENTNLLKDTHIATIEAMEEWCKPEIRVIPVNEGTLGNPGGGPDCSHHSGSTCS
jgi:hypothetical protein